MTIGLYFLLTPSICTFLTIGLSTAFVALTTWVGYLMFFKRKESNKKVTYMGLFLRNFLCSMAAQYTVIIVGFLFSFIAELAGWDLAVNSEFPLEGAERIIADIMQFLLLALCMAVTFLGSYYITLRSIVLSQKKRLLVCLYFSILNGATLMPFLILSMMLTNPYLRHLPIRLDLFYFMHFYT